MLALSLLGLGGAGCGSTTRDESAGAESAVEQGAVIEFRGRAFMRRDAWLAEDLERIAYEGRAEQPSSSPAVLAAQLRVHMARGDAYYIELEPNVELAERILRGEVGPNTEASGPREGRTIIGTDERSLYGGPTSYPATTFAFNESRGSGVRIGQSTLYTAAHVVYQTEGANQWFCHDGTTTPGCSRPRWRFGVDGTTAFAGWTGYNCEVINIPTAFVNLVGATSANQWDWARFDFAVVDLSSCAAGNTGWLGTWITADQTLLDMTAYHAGYPARATCPTGSQGDTGSTSNGTNVLGTDCPGTGSWPGSTYRLNNTTAPYAGAKAYFSSTTDVSAGTLNPSYTIKTTVDLTHGNSGGPLYYLFATGASSASRRSRRRPTISSTAGRSRPTIGSTPTRRSQVDVPFSFTRYGLARAVLSRGVLRR